jgi:hypothetical protein
VLCVNKCKWQVRNEMRAATSCKIGRINNVGNGSTLLDIICGHQASFSCLPESLLCLAESGRFFATTWRTRLTAETIIVIKDPEFSGPFSVQGLKCTE